jgi:hypothetical protein
MRKKERKICQRFVKGEKDARHAATRRHTHTQRERERDAERCREKKEPPSLSLIREETKKHSINYPPSSGPNSLRENRSKRVALSSRSTNRNLPENERQTTTRDE